MRGRGPLYDGRAFAPSNGGWWSCGRDVTGHHHSPGSCASRGPRTGGSVKTAKLISVVLIVALTVMLVQPARAEAIEPMTIITIVGAAVLVVAIIAVVVIANVRDEQRGAALEPPMVAVLDPGGAQGL